MNNRKLILHMCEIGLKFTYFFTRIPQLSQHNLSILHWYAVLSCFHVVLSTPVPISHCLNSWGFLACLATWWGKSSLLPISKSFSYISFFIYHMHLIITLSNSLKTQIHKGSIWNKPHRKPIPGLIQELLFICSPSLFFPLFLLV